MMSRIVRTPMVMKEPATIQSNTACCFSLLGRALNSFRVIVLCFKVKLPTRGESNSPCDHPLCHFPHISFASK